MGPARIVQEVRQSVSALRQIPPAVGTRVRVLPGPREAGSEARSRCERQGFLTVA